MGFAVALRIFLVGRVLTACPKAETRQGGPKMSEDIQVFRHAEDADESSVDLLQLKTLTCGTNAEAVRQFLSTSRAVCPSFYGSYVPGENRH
jgi:hypothetical protein